MALKRAQTTDKAPETDATAQVDNEALAKAQEQAELEAKSAEADKQAEAGTEAAAEPETATATATATEAKPEPEPDNTAGEVQPEQVKEVAVVTEGAVVHPGAAPGAVGGAMQAFTAEMAAEGYEGMNLTGMSFDRVKLHEAQFLLGSEDVKLGESIQVRIMSTRSIYVVRQHDGQKAEMFYSYDPAGKFKTDGSSAKDVLDEWLEEGYGDAENPLQIKQYIEGMAQLVNRTDEYDQHMVSLSIPPASRDRLAGAFAVGKQRFKCHPGDLVIECKVGNKVGTGDEAFRPWVFKAHSVAQD